MSSKLTADFDGLELKVILTGVGGQGVIFTTRLLAQTAILLGLQVIASETHGMSQRGGSVLSHLKIGGIEAPLIRKSTADVLFSLDQIEAERHLPYVKRSGVIFANSENGLRSEVMNHVKGFNIQVFCLPATRMALDLGSATITNVLLVGFATAHPSLPLPIETLGHSLADMMPKGGDLNQRALEQGYQAGLAAFGEKESTGLPADIG